MTVPIPFRTVRKPEEARRPRKVKRSWTELVQQIAGVGKRDAIFVSLDSVSDADMKYLMLALKRRGKGERLRTVQTVIDGVEGRLLWAEVVSDDSAAAGA